MTLYFKNFRLLKTKRYVKKNNFFFFVYGINRFSNNWVIVEQELKKLNFKYCKMFNKSTDKVFAESIFLHIRNIIGSTLFFISTEKNHKTLSRASVKELTPIFFNVASVRLNKKIYTNNNLLKNSYSLNYLESKLVFYQFIVCGIEPFQKL